MPNPSFEQHDTCPNTYGQICYATGWESFSVGGEEYFNSCDTSNFFSVPYNTYGYQKAFDGQGYAGFVFYNPFAINQRESIGCKLIDSLKIGYRYYISFYVNLANTSQCAINNLGILFSTKTFNTSRCYSQYWNLIRNYAHLNCQHVITDTLNWVKIKGTFLADSSYQYLIISNFFDDLHTIIDTLYSDTVFTEPAHYYVDMVCVSTDSLTCNPTDAINENVILNDDITVFPIPTSGFINININNPDLRLITYKLFDTYGSLLKHGNIYSRAKIDVSDCKEGVYILQIKTQNKLLNKKIIIN